MAKAKRKKTTTLTRKRTPPAKKHKNPRSRGARGLASTDEGKILIATLAMQVIAMLVGRFTKSLKIDWLPPQFLVPGLIYLAAKYNLIPVDGLKTVAFTMLANNAWRLLGLDYAGTYAGTYAGVPDQFTPQAWARSPQETAAALIDAQTTGCQGQHGRMLAERKYGRDMLQVRQNQVYNTEKLSLQRGRMLATRKYRN